MSISSGPWNFRKARRKRMVLTAGADTKQFAAEQQNTVDRTADRSISDQIMIVVSLPPCWTSVRADCIMIRGQTDSAAISLLSHGS